jgi:methionine sulfoxide reductase heme-binding subunit
MSVAAAAAGSQGLWFVSRASGLVLLVLFSAVIVLGVATRLGSAPRRWPRFVFAELHRTLALFSVAFLALHVVTAILDPFVSIGWAATVPPFLSGYRTLPIGLGTLAVDLGGAVLVTSLLRRRMGFGAWRAVHWLAYLARPVAFRAFSDGGQRPGHLVGGADRMGIGGRGGNRRLGTPHRSHQAHRPGRPSAGYERITPKEPARQ